MPRPLAPLNAGVPATFIARWQESTITQDGCLLWTGSVKDNGYGQTCWHRRTVTAHRVAWQMIHGPIPDGLCVMHTCDVRACVNPAHLRLGTFGDNNRDTVAKGRHRNQHSRASSDTASDAPHTDPTAAHTATPTMGGNPA